MHSEHTHFELVCDSCPFNRTETDRLDAHRAAMEHEQDYPDHYVSLVVSR